jgi:transcriptional regulator GlxA family with amidase domain
MRRTLPERAIRALTVTAGAELRLKLPSGSSLLLLTRECEVQVLSGSVHEAVPARAASDARVGRALQAMQRCPSRRWTVAALAKQAGMSRAAFARAFRNATGQTPLAWLCRERLQRAAELLQTSDAKLAELAENAGYATEFAFSRAFKRLFGIPPARFRRAAHALQALHLPHSSLRCAA